MPETAQAQPKPATRQPRALQSQDGPPQRKGSKRRRPLVPEAAIQVAISDWLSVAGIPHAITDASLGAEKRARVTPGWADLTACWCGQLVAIEVKRADGRVRPEQQRTLDELEAAGAYVMVARSLGDVVERFAALVPQPAAVGTSRVHKLWRAIEGYRKGHGAK